MSSIYLLTEVCSLLIVSCFLSLPIFLFLCRHKPSLPEAFCIWVCPTVSESVCQCVSKTLWTPYLKNQWKEFPPFLITDVYVLIDVLIRFWGQRSRLQQALTRKTGWIQPLNCWSYFHQHQITHVPGPEDILITFQVKGPRSQQGEA